MNKGAALVRVPEHILRDLCSLGYLDRHLARAFGVGHGTIWARRKQWGIESGRGRGTEEDQQ